MRNLVVCEDIFFRDFLDCSEGEPLDFGCGSDEIFVEVFELEHAVVLWCFCGLGISFVGEEESFVGFFCAFEETVDSHLGEILIVVFQQIQWKVWHFFEFCSHFEWVEDYFYVC